MGPDRLIAALEGQVPGLAGDLLDMPHLVCILLDKDLCVIASNGAPDDPLRPVPMPGRWLSDGYSTAHIHPIIAELTGSPQAVSLPGRDGAPRLVGHFYSVPQGILFMGEIRAPADNDAMIREISSLNDELAGLKRRLAESRVTDHLTGLKTRRALQPLLESEAARMQRHGLESSIILMALDPMEDMGNGSDPAAGDRILAAVGKLIRDQIRLEDTPCRWGPKEFLILLPHAAVVQAKACARRIQAAMAGLKPPGIARGITASFGISRLSRDDSGERAIHLADQALFAARQGGPNRIWIHMPGSDSGQT